VSRRRPDLRLKAEVLLPKGAVSVLTHEAQRKEDEQYGDVIVFHLEVGRKALLLVGAIVTDLLLSAGKPVLSILNGWIDVPASSYASWFGF
jgi:hypothetical protein